MIEFLMRKYLSRYLELQNTLLSYHHPEFISGSIWKICIRF